MNPKQSAHAMLEPLDYDLDHAEAEKLLSGDELELYKLLWSAGVATVCEGPVVRDHTIELRAIEEKEALGLIPASYGRELIEEGWRKLLPHEPLPDEDVRPPSDDELVRLLKRVVPPAQLTVARQARGIDAGYLDPNQKGGWTVEVEDTSPPGLDGADLIELMAARGVGRPSTYSKTFHQALQHGLIAYERGASGSLGVGGRGERLIAAMDALPSDQRIGWELSAELETALRDIEDQPNLAGAILNRFCSRFFGQECALADWLDGEEIEGESLTAFMERKTRALPPANSWEGVTLPLGLAPRTLAIDPDGAIELRRQMDEIVAAPSPAAWRALAPRARAASRLAALATTTADGEAAWRVRGTADVVIRWWIDLGPAESPLTYEELEAGAARLRETKELLPLATRVLEVLALRD